MKVLEYNNKIYYLKLSVKQYIAIHQLGIVERLASYPTTLDYISICNILMNDYNFNEDELYDFMDFIVEEYDINSLLAELLIDSGIAKKQDDTEALEESESNLSDDEIEHDTSDYMTFDEQLQILMQDCLGYGMDIDTFYSMTLKEIELYVEGVKKKINRENHDKAMLDYALANLITTGTGIVLGSKSEFPKFEDYYGKMLGEEYKENEEDLVLEGYADGSVPVYRKKIDNVEDDLFRKQLLAVAQVSKAQSIQKQTNIGDGVME